MNKTIKETSSNSTLQSAGATSIGIGIDTGGTYTDAVIYNFATSEILSTAKALTTKEDLSIGILEALDVLPIKLLKQAELISLSTTLATNACVEGKGGNAKLIFFGGDSKVIDSNGPKYGLPPSSDMYIQESFTKFSGDIEQDVDWELFCKQLEKDFHGLDGVGIIEINAIRNAAVIEKKARDLFQQKHDLPVVCAHDLFNELNCLQRGAGVLLNAQLIPIIKEFLQAIKKAVKLRGLDISMVIVRSDGGLMSSDFASVRPVETLLCGPAASVLGGGGLVNEPNNIVVDMGGTTTDIALIREGNPVKVVGGVRVGKWRTFVKGLYINTFGLGGDTAIHYDATKIFLEEYRVIPLCVAANEHPQITENLKELLEKTHRHSKYLHEHYILIKDISNNPRYTDNEKSFCTALKNGPLILRDAGSAVPGHDMYTFNVSRLLREGVVQICGLTPTDIMHIKGDFNPFSAEASLLGAKFVASNLNLSVDELCDHVYDEIKRKLYVNIVKAMLENEIRYYANNDVSGEGERFINESYNMAKKRLYPARQSQLPSDNESESSPGLTVSFSLQNFVLTGVGAPIHIFLDDVAKMLGTKAIIPKHCEVANALGAIVGNVNATITVEIRPSYDDSGITDYTVYGLNKTKKFSCRKKAEAFALQEAKAAAREEAIKRGAKGEITITHKLSIKEAEARDGMFYLGTQATALAVGTLGF